MSLRYKGIPDKGSNVIADKLSPLCFCRFVAVGMPLLSVECEVHNDDCYGCDDCMCADYRPSRIKEYPSHWPRCVCGHIAQQHNQTHIL